MQPGILASLPAHGRFVSFALRADPARALAGLQAVWSADDVLGIGPATAAALGARIPGLADPTPVLSPVVVPATPTALWFWLRGDDPGALFHRDQALRAVVGAAFAVESVLDGFVHAGGRDLTGYEDGTENPVDEAAVAAARCTGLGPGLDGGSFVATQTWRHDLARFAGWPKERQDAVIGRERISNDELDDAPASAHVRRTAQEDFAPAAFVVRRSMPWAADAEAGLEFVAFGASPAPFQALLRRMTGQDDGVVDALFGFSTPLNTRSLWCPPWAGGLDLRALGLAAP